MISFNNVSKRYSGGMDALLRLNFDIPKGDMVFLTGPSGAGKSTLLKLIMLIERPSAGEVFVDGQSLRGLTSWDIPYHRRKIGVVFQDHQLLSDRNVFENVALPLRIAGFAQRDIGRRVRAALDKVGLLHRESHNPKMLSGGEQQRVGIARAVVNKPRVILADEPTGNLDPQLSAEIMSLFQQFQQVGVTLLVASHDLALVASMPCRVLSLRGGQLVSGDGV